MLKREDGRRSRAFLRENFLSYHALSNIVQLRTQLKRYMSDIGFVASSSSAKDCIGGEAISLIRAVIAASMYPNVIVAPKKFGMGSSSTAGEVPFRGQKGDVYLHPSKDKRVVAIDEWLKFRCDAKPATLVKYLRQSMEVLLLEKIMDPSMDIAASIKGTAVIQSVTQLLMMETK